MGWYCLKVKSGCEATAVLHLRNQKYTVFYPQLESYKNSKRILKPLFLGYVFIYLTPGLDSFGAVKNTRHVEYFLQKNNIETVHDNIIGLLKKNTDDKEIFNTNLDKYIKGDEVVLSRGAFKFMKAVVEAHERDRILVLIDGKKIQITTDDIF